MYGCNNNRVVPCDLIRILAPHPGCEQVPMGSISGVTEMTKRSITKCSVFSNTRKSRGSQTPAQKAGDKKRRK